SSVFYSMTQYCTSGAPGDKTPPWSHSVLFPKSIHSYHEGLKAVSWQSPRPPTLILTPDSDPKGTGMEAGVLCCPGDPGGAALPYTSLHCDLSPSLLLPSSFLSNFFLFYLFPVIPVQSSEALRLQTSLPSLCLSSAFDAPAQTAASQFTDKRPKNFPVMAQPLQLGFRFESAKTRILSDPGTEGPFSLCKWPCSRH
ncbi:hypothetical protein JZ751_023595, partial [Albula glossodonta]